jgi:cyclophilin family peptidyl-prolyl cis-trans isomerase
MLTTQRLSLIASAALAFACTASQPPPKDDTADKKAEVDGEVPGQGSADAKAEADAKAAAEKAEEAQRAAEAAKKAAEAAKQRPKRTFRRGQNAPKGLTVEELYEYNKSQGDPIDGEFTLEMAFEGDEALKNHDNGTLYAEFQTTMGDFACVLFEDKAPISVANFVGLARGTRPWRDKKTDTWMTTPFYDGVLFHRVIKNFMLQTGDRSGTGTGSPGFLVPDELDTGLTHNKAGILSMANRGPNTGSSQFFVTVTKTPHLDGKHAVFGQCEPKIPVKISEVKVKSMPGVDSRPLDDVSIKTIKIERRAK